MKRSCLSISVAILLLYLGCGPKEAKQPVSEKRYVQTFQCVEALFVRERNGQPTVMASAFLVDRQRGIFASAKHFVGSESDGDCKIFFNGRVYDGFLLRLPPVTDIAMIKIEGEFDSANFPEPYKIAIQVRIGDKVFVRGIHPHPGNLQAGHQVLRIFSEYYGLVGMNNEFVYDSLESKLMDINTKISNKNIKGSSEELVGVTNTYFKLKAKDDHQFSFGGLSGGPTVNNRDELVGVNSNEIPGGYELTSKGLIKRPWEILHLVPASEVEKLLPQLADIR